MNPKMLALLIEKNAKFISLCLDPNITVHSPYVIHEAVMSLQENVDKLKELAKQNA